MEIRCNTVGDGLAQGLSYILHHGVEESSRNGPVLAAPEPVLITYRYPKNRVLFSPLRDANPFFHFMEAMWMLAGHCDLDWPRHFNSRFVEFSDDGVNLNGAYGYRWRTYFQRDQLEDAIRELTTSPYSRRVVIGMWDARRDLNSESKDIPCNTHIYVDTRDGNVNMTVCNRSNDVLWGTFGANAVHMSFLQEYIACRLCKPIGVYRQFTNNLHLYTDVLPRERAMHMVLDLKNSEGYSEENFWVSYPLLRTRPDFWREDLEKFLRFADPTMDFVDPFFTKIAAPMLMAWQYRHDELGLTAANLIAAPDWRRACCEWIERRRKNAKSS